MEGGRIIELQKALNNFVQEMELHGNNERIGIVEFGGRTGITCELTSDYPLLNSCIGKMKPSGKRATALVGHQ